MGSKVGDEFVYDSAAFINGANHHYYPDTMPGVWEFVEQKIDCGEVIVVRAVYKEVTDQEDEMSKLVARHKAAVVEPSSIEVQQLVGEYQTRYFSKQSLRDEADPWVMAEAKIRSAIVVTYEGITFDGKPAKKAHEKLPALCAKEGIRCCTLPESLRALGLKLG